jgi:Leucine-rich repeat (LRR) protein
LNDDKTVLTLGRNVEKIPDEIQYLTELEVIESIYSGLSHLPETIIHLENLKLINIQYGNLESLPEGITVLFKIEEINLRGNKLILLPDQFGGLFNLKKLTLSSNRLMSLPYNIGSLGGNLKELMLNGNLLESLPDSITKLYNLEILDVSDNVLTQLPYLIGDLTNLIELRASNNRLTSLPESIGNIGRFGFKLYIKNNKGLSRDSLRLPKSMKKLLSHAYISADPKTNEVINKMRQEMKEEMKQKIIGKFGSKRKLNNFPAFGENNENEPERKIQKIKARYFDSNKNKYLFEDVNKFDTGDASNKKCSYCKKDPIISYNTYKNNESHFICSQNCSNKIFYNLHN